MTGKPAGRRTIPPLKALATLECVVRHGSVTLAADELCLTHGAVSKQLATLTAWVGQPLFSDNRRKMVPTAAARRLAKGVEQGMAPIYAAVDDVRGTAAAMADLHVIAPATLAMYWLIPQLPALRRSGLKIKTHVRYTHARDHWTDFPFDVAIRPDDEAPEAYRCAPIFADRLGLVAAPGLASVVRTADDLRHVTVLESETRPGELDAWLAALSLGRSDIGVIEAVEHNYVAIEAALTGQGAVVAPLTVVGRHLAGGTLVQLLAQTTVPGPRFSAVYDPRSAGGRHAGPFTDWLRAIAAEGMPPTLARVAG